MYLKKVLSFFIVLFFANKVQSHGRLLDPPSRASAWRSYAGFPVNYDDHGMNCGGVYVQWTLNGGRCGICGEAWYTSFLI